MTNIRRMLLAVAALLMTTGMLAASPSDKLFKRLKKIQKRTWNAYMFGHQDDTFYGLTWSWDKERSDTKELVGDYPAVMGFDLGGIEMADKKNLDSVPFTRIEEEIIAQHERGGIVTVSWHPRNPLTGGNAWDVTSKEVVKSILPGGKENAKFKLWMQRVGDFLSRLKTSKGEAVPVIFRPWHENNGSWFWWGHDLCTDSEYKALWNMLQDYLVKERGLDNLLWSYSPNLDGGWNLRRWYERYPGDDRVSLIGEDAYQWGTEKEYVTALRADLEFISVYAGNHGKLYALTECGYKNNPDATWFTRVFKKLVDNFEISYFLLWRNDKKEWFGPSKGQKCADDFIRLYKAENTLFLNDVKDIK